MKERYLTKSRFKLAMECPTKLYYTGKKEYVDTKLEDPFLRALAEGGFQVGELAKRYFPKGHEIESLDYQESLDETNSYLKQNKVILYEAAIQYNNFFIRSDILIKEGNDIKIIEVKAKSIDLTKDTFIGKRGGVLSEWKPYLYDIAFQKYVANKAFPNYNISAYLMLVDKNSLCPVDGLNQKFKIARKKDGRKYVIISSDLTEKDLSVPILVEVNIDEECELIYTDTYEIDNNNFNFDDLVNFLSKEYFNDRSIKPRITKACKTCEFVASELELEQGFKSGLKECFKAVLDWNDSDFDDDTIFDIWDFRTIDKFINQGLIKLNSINKNHISPDSDGKPGLSRTKRQWIQIEKSQNNNSPYWIDKENLKNEMENWIFPFHFIDFETIMPAIPFNKNRCPYEGIAFQFSHHIVYDDGRVEHKGQYLNIEPGVFPNYEFIKKLKEELENDDGTIFRYASHENTYLNFIYAQLENDKIENRKELCEFIRTITEYKVSKNKIVGPRNMVDMLRLVKRYYYDSAMKGSNSIKAVLPAILNSSKFLQDKYSKPIYGTDRGIPSLNFKDWTWIKHENNEIIDPYKLLPKMFKDLSEKDLAILGYGNELNDGGAAMTAYARLQFEDMPDYERSEIQNALLKYCELDTLAMVMVYEGWKDMISFE